MVHATGSAGTQAGLVAGLVAVNAQIPVLGIGVRAPKDRQEANVFALAEKTCAHVGVPGAVKREHIVANCDYVGQGYGIPTEGMVEALKLVAKLLVAKCHLLKWALVHLPLVVKKKWLQ